MENAAEVVKVFRNEVRDVAKPYLWSNEEVYGFLLDAYLQYGVKTGGVPDFISADLIVSVSAGERFVDLHPSILRVISAFRVSDGVEVITRNLEEIGTNGEKSVDDYGLTRSRIMADQPGPVRYMILGVAPDKALLVDTPIDDDELNLYVMRTTLDTEISETHTLSEIPLRHRMALVHWMKHRAFSKHDADTYDPKAAKECENDFIAYCAGVKFETERKQAKPRVVSYGGI